MNPKLEDLLKEKQKIAFLINGLACQQRELTLEIQKLEKAQRKEDLLGNAETKEKENG